MYNRIFTAYNQLSKGDVAELKRCNLKKMADVPAYFRILKMTGLADNDQTLRVLFLMTGLNFSADDAEKRSVAIALQKAGVKESQILQITRSGDNGIEYLKRQLIRCNQLDLNSLGKLAQYWGDTVRRSLLKEYILAEQD
jgi:CRISPR system Cascade subunit CasB